MQVLETQRYLPNIFYNYFHLFSHESYFLYRVRDYTQKAHCKIYVFSQFQDLATVLEVLKELSHLQREVIELPVYHLILFPFYNTEPFYEYDT
jgi:hypothetical protein